MDEPRARLYANHPDAMASAPRPWILDRDFLAYHSIRAVTGHAEAAVRA
jgi:hypothetical protein